MSNTLRVPGTQQDYNGAARITISWQQNKRIKNECSTTRLPGSGFGLFIY